MVRLYLVVAVLGLPCTAVAQLDTSPPSFGSHPGVVAPAPQTRSSTTNDGQKFACADFDGDGWVDVIVTRDGQSWLAPGRGRAGFAEPYLISSAASADINFSGAADFNGDSVPDYVTLLYGSQAPRLALGRGDGTFTFPSVPAIGVLANDAVTVDLDLDGRSDLVAVGSNKLALYRGDAASGLTPYLILTAPFNFHVNAQLAAADLNGDLAPDFIAIQFNPNGTTPYLRTIFTSGSSYVLGPQLVSPTIPSHIGSLAIGDVNNDGFADVVYTLNTLQGGSTQLRYFAGNGAGQFSASQDLPVDFGLWGNLYVRDLDHDQRNDLLLVTAPSIHSALQTSSGGWTAPIASSSGSIWTTELEGNDPIDLDGDGYFDLVGAADGSHGVAMTVSYGLADGSFGPRGTPTVESGTDNAPLDVDLDGDLDLVIGVNATTGSNVNGVIFALNDGAGDFSSQTFVAVGSGPPAQCRVHATDLDLDGRTDVVVSTSDGLFGLRNTPSGFVQLPPAFAGESVAYATLGDIDGDGDLDAYCAMGGQTAAKVARNDGLSGFVHTTTLAFSFVSSMVGDFNADGFADVVFSQSGSELRLYLADGNGGVSSFYDAPSLSTSCLGLLPVDFDLDGDLDVLAASCFQTNFVWRNDGLGNLGAPENLGWTPVPGSASAFADLNGDGLLDVVSGERAAVLIFERASDGGFADVAVVASSSRSVLRPSVFDVDADGDLDIVHTGRATLPFGGPTFGGTIEVVRNQRPQVATYCKPKGNSLGCHPSITFTGSPSASSAGPFQVGARRVINQRSGLLFYGFGARHAPFQGGTMCVQSPTQRTPVQNAGGAPLGADDCSGSYSYDFQARIQSGADAALVVGARVFAQYWARDPASPSTTALTDAVTFEIGQ